MKLKYSILVMLLMSVICVSAQTTKWIKDRVSVNLVQNAEHIKVGGKKVKNGESFIVDLNNAELARGNYRNGNKDSIWNYFG